MCLQADFVQAIAKLAEEGVIAGISDIRDESDRDGMRVVVEMKRGTSAEVHPPTSVQAMLYTPKALNTCSMGGTRFAGGTEQSLQAHDPSVQVCLQYGRPGGRHTAVTESEGVP